MRCKRPDIHTPPTYTSDMPRVLLNFQHYGNAWTVHFIEADCRTTIGSRTRYFNFATLDAPPQLRGVLPAPGRFAGQVRRQRLSVEPGQRVCPSDGGAVREAASAHQDADEVADLEGAQAIIRDGILSPFTDTSKFQERLCRKLPESLRTRPGYGRVRFSIMSLVPERAPTSH